MSWLILFTPCNQYKVRFERLLELYDSLVGDQAPKLLSNAVKVWRPFKAKGSCDERRQYVQKYLDEALSEVCAHPDQIEDPNFPITRCTICYTRWNEYIGSGQP